jgi:ABC-2 type transport system permease protein
VNRAITLVAGREIRQRLRSRLFVVVTLLFAAVLAGAAAVPGGLDRVMGGTAPTAAPDAAGPVEVVVVGDLSQARRLAVERGAGEGATLTAVPDEVAARAALDAGAAFAVLDGGDRLLAPPPQGPFDPLVPTAVVEGLGLAAALEAAGGSAAQLAAALDAAPVAVDVVDLDGGVDPATAAARFAVAYGGSFLLYLALVLFASLVATGVVEEKSSRVVELLLPAVPARLLMLGKLLGLGIVGAVQITVIVAPALVIAAARVPGGLPSGVAPAVVALIAFFVLGFALYAGMAAGLASLAARAEDLQSVVLPVYAVLVVAFTLTFPTLGAPETTLATVATFVPFSAPFVVPVRMALVELPLWQVGLSALGVVVTALALALLAARIYEHSIIRGGGRVRLRQAWRGDA